VGSWRRFVVLVLYSNVKSILLFLLLILFLLQVLFLFLLRRQPARVCACVRDAGVAKNLLVKVMRRKREGREEREGGKDFTRCGVLSDYNITIIP